MFYLLSFLILSSFSPKNEVNPFLGTWKSYSISSFQDEYEIKEGQFSDFSSTITFHKDLTYTKVTRGRTIHGKYEFTDTKLKFYEANLNHEYIRVWMIRWPEGELLSNLNYPELFSVEGGIRKVELDVFYKRTELDKPSEFKESEVSFCDTIYHDENWELTSEENHRNYSILKVKDSIVNVQGFSKKGKLYATGAYYLLMDSLGVEDPLNSLEDGNELGPFELFGQNGEVISLRVYDLPNYMELLGSYSEEISLPDSVLKRVCFERNFDKQGNVKREGLLINGEEWHGKWIEYHRKGQSIFYKAEFDNGFRDGETIYYYSGGELMESTTYKKGVKDGKSKKYDFSGRLKSESIYLDGKLISKETF